MSDRTAPTPRFEPVLRTLRLADGALRANVANVITARGDRVKLLRFVLPTLVACAPTPDLHFVEDDGGDDAAMDPDAMRSLDSATNDARGALDASMEDVVSTPSVDATTGDARCSVNGSLNATCDACLSTYCCDQANACFANMGCVAIVDCIRPCAGKPGNGCRASCEANNPSGKAPFDAVAECLTSTCGAKVCL